MTIASKEKRRQFTTKQKDYSTRTYLRTSSFSYAYDFLLVIFPPYCYAPEVNGI